MYQPSFVSILEDRICSTSDLFYAYIYDKLLIQYLDVPNKAVLYQ